MDGLAVTRSGYGPTRDFIVGVAGHAFRVEISQHVYPCREGTRTSAASRSFAYQLQYMIFPRTEIQALAVHLAQ